LSALPVPAATMRLDVKLFARSVSTCFVASWQSKFKDANSDIHPVFGRRDSRVAGVTGGEVRAMSSHAPSQTGRLLHAWLILAGLAAAAIGLLCWGAWVYGYDPLWFTRSPTWLRSIMQPNQDRTPLVTMALLL